MQTKYFVILVISICVDATPTFTSSKNFAENYNRPHGWDEQHETYKSIENLENNLIRIALEHYSDQENEFIPIIYECLYQNNEVDDKINCITNYFRENKEGKISNSNHNVIRYSDENVYDHHDLTQSESVDTKDMLVPAIPFNGDHYVPLNGEHTLQKNYEYPRPELELLQLIKQKANDLKLETFKRCFMIRNDNDRKRCMKDTIERTGRQGMEDSNSFVSELEDDEDKIKPERIEMKKFSQDYLDVNDLLRRNKNMDDKNTKKRIIFKIVPNENKYSRFDYDLTGLRKFNPKNDKEILRTNHDSNDKNTKKRIIFKIVPNENKLATVDNEDNKTKNILRTVPDDYSDSDLSSSEEDGQENIDQIDDRSSSEEIKIKKKLKPKVEPAVYYMQGPSRMYGHDSRRRLPHFLPKRYHWDEDDMKELKNYWFQGPQGKYPGHYRTPY